MRETSRRLCGCAAARHGNFQRRFETNDSLGQALDFLLLGHHRGRHALDLALLDSMEALFDLLGNEPAPAVRAVLGHHLFVFIHPYFDGNGRLGRFLMNVMLASGGYPWTVIRMKSRKRYMEALEDASVKGNIKPFAQFVLDEMNDWRPEKS